MGAQNFNSVSKFPENGGFQGPDFVFLEADFPSLMFGAGWGAAVPSNLLPQRCCLLLLPCRR